MDLVDGVGVTAQEPGQPDAVGAGVLDAEGHHAAIGADVAHTERQELGEPGQSGGDEKLAESSAEAVDEDGDVLVFVGVDSDDDIVAP